MNIEVVHVERAWYIFSRQQHLAGREGVERSVGIPEDSEQEKEQKYRTTYYMYQAIGERISYTPSVECKVG